MMFSEPERNKKMANFEDTVTSVVWIYLVIKDGLIGDQVIIDFFIE